MKQRIFTLLLIAATALSACRKNDVDPDIKAYDEQQIQNYITANGLSDMSRFQTADSSGLYYKIINPGTGPALEYSDRVSLVFTLKSFDGRYAITDTIRSHFDDYLGHIAQDGLPEGLQTAIHDILKYRDGSMRLLIPSHLAYGVAGFGSGSISNVNTRIAGNQSLDYYVHVINDQQAYDDLVMRNYMKTNNLTGYTKDENGTYYKILNQGTGGVGSIYELSTLNVTYVGNLMNGEVFDEINRTTATSMTMSSITVPGLATALKTYGAAGASLSFLIPSRFAYGTNPPSSSIIPVHAPLRFDYQITTVTNP